VTRATIKKWKNEGQDMPAFFFSTEWQNSGSFLVITSSLSTPIAHVSESGPNSSLLTEWLLCLPSADSPSSLYDVFFSQL
jgi:hypothetical protein